MQQLHFFQLQFPETPSGAAELPLRSWKSGVTASFPLSSFWVGTGEGRMIFSLFLVFLAMIKLLFR